ncbi:SMP-30/gluconolactonase/LRE family protein [Hymenobacter endophyticus]|uniref:SMP-30/gluconolactonase/LRE family protein n=1 Tax=Hymenobacter endophyticus TaxID=3076335 RepID=A0ABU3THB2_9BACT|nr:SMP-30/gluconolactonase/LRE family protein [Hymenobacter endophyticus]MDU0370730.1 SMP-30/gluconolactonase/LRE family protein [Hymenobacter endophyticus]
MKYCSFYPLAAVGILLLGALGAVSANAQSSSNSVVAAGATPRLVSRQFSFTEGPAVDRAGNVFFTDQPNNRIWKYDTRGQLSIFLEPAGRANGTYFDQKGNLLACADEHNQLWSIAPDGTVTVRLRDVQGHTLNGPNDLWVQPKTGGIYFTDPYYQRPYWTRQAPDPNLGGQKVYYLPPNQTTAVPVDDKLQQPNGIIGTPDGKLLYVADIGAGKTYRYQIGPDGRLQNRQLFVEQGSDGMTIDRQGNVYLTGNGVTVYSPAGQKIEQIAIPEKWTANVCFAGKKRDTLFITASEAVYILPMRVRGAQ